MPRTLVRWRSAIAALPRRAGMRALMLGFAFAATTACGDDDRNPITAASLTGSYNASVFTVTAFGSTIDVLRLGGRLEVTLASGGVATGLLFVPATVTGGSARTESLAGTWTYTGGVVRLNPAGDTFGADLELRPSGRSGTRLEGTYVDDGATARVVLTKR